MLRWQPLVVLAAFAFVVPTASAGSATFDFRSGSLLVIILDGEITGEDAASLRFQIDQNGDRNGDVSQAEVDEFEQDTMDAINQFGQGGAPGGTYTVNDREPNQFEQKDFELEDALGSAESEEPINARFEFELRFPVDVADEYTVKVEGESGDGQGTSEANIDEATLKAPEGYHIKSAEGLPEGASVSRDKRSIRFDGEPAPTETMVIVFAKGSAGTPGPGFVLLLAALGAAAVVRRRR